MSENLRVFYAAGPGNAFAAFREWKEGRRDLINSHLTYSRQVFDVCAKFDAPALITCTYDGDEEQSHHKLSVVRRSDPSRGKSGLDYHFSVRKKAQQNIRDVAAFGANVVIISEDTNPIHYTALHRRGVHIVQSLHTRLWREDRSPSAMQRLRLRGFGHAYASGITTVLSSSNVVSDQVRQLSQRRPPKILEFLPSYYEDHYSGLPEPAADEECLQILFIGRVEENKGVLDLVDIAGQLAADGVVCKFHICGIGGALEEMKRRVVDRRLAENFLFHGWCDRDALRNVMSQCQISIVPTRGDFIEGFNNVIVESVLAGRPVVASSICPAVQYVGDAAQVVLANDVPQYVSALRELSLDRTKLLRRIQSCSTMDTRFTDGRSSLATALEEVFSAIRERRPVRERVL